MKLSIGIIYYKFKFRTKDTHMIILITYNPEVARIRGERATMLAINKLATQFFAATDVSWAIGAYMIAFGVALIPGGRLGDMWGRKRTMMVGLGAFVLASAAAGLADSTAELVSWRIVQGLAGGLYSPLAISLVSTTVEPARKGRVLGVVMAAAALGTAAGPIVGGAVTATVGWRWVLLVNLPIGVVAMIWGLAQLPESRDVEAAARGLTA